MLNFKKVTLYSKDEITPYLEYAPLHSADHSFIELFMWVDVLGTEYTISEDMLFVRFTRVGDENIYKMPIGKNDPKKALEKLPEGAKIFVQEPQLEYFKNEPQAYRNSFEYVYDVQKLISLSGKALSKKRNNLNKFIRHYDFEYVKMTAKEAKQCSETYEEWFNEHSQRGDELFNTEKERMQFILNNIQDFNVKGGILYVGGNIASFTLSEDLDKETVIIHFEKASPKYIGAYAAINKLHLENEWAYKKYVNRLDDAGVEGLRRAKMEYNPEFFIKKYMARHCYDIEKNRR